MCYYFAAGTTHALDSNITYGSPWMRCMQTHLQPSPVKPDVWAGRSRKLNSCFYMYPSHSSVGYCHIPGLAIPSLQQPCTTRNPNTRHGGPDPQVQLRGAALCGRQVALRPRVRCGAQGEPWAQPPIRPPLLEGLQHCKYGIKSATFSSAQARSFPAASRCLTVIRPATCLLDEFNVPT